METGDLQKIAEMMENTPDGRNPHYNGNG